MLTERIIRDASPNKKTYIIWDKTVKGLGLRVTAAGAKSYVLDYYVGSRRRRATLARASEISLKAARERAGPELAAIRAGGTDLLERKDAIRRAPTVNDALDKFFNEWAPDRIATGRLARSTLNAYRNQANNHLRPALGKRLVKDITRADIEAMTKRFTGVPTLRNRVLALTSRLFNLFEVWEMRPQYTNPVRGVDRTRLEPRDRTLAPSELATLAGALKDAEERNPAAVTAIRVAAVTGLRISEILSIRWADVDFETGRLTLPKTKTGRRLHDLPAVALAIMSALPRINAWVFTIGRDAPVMYRTVRIYFAHVAKQAGLEDVRLHDLRRTVMTNAAAAGVGAHVLRDLLGHKTTAMADRYVRAVGNPVREAREQVGAAMAAMMEGKTGEVVPIDRRHG